MVALRRRRKVERARGGCGDYRIWKTSAGAEIEDDADVLRSSGI